MKTRQIIVIQAVELNEPYMNKFEQYLKNGWMVKQLSTTTLDNKIAVTLLLEKEEKE